MARYQNAMQTPGPSINYADAIARYMLDEGFKQKTYKGREYWQKGVGVFITPMYVSLCYRENMVHIEAFLRIPILPGVCIGETGLTGIWAARQKLRLKRRIETMEWYIYTLWYPAYHYTSIVGQARAPSQSPYQ